MITKEKALKLRRIIEKASKLLEDVDALDAVELFPKWDVEISYNIGDRARYSGELYKCVQAHTSQTGWEPPNVPALFTKVAEPGEIPVWVQPTGAHDAYNIGDKVHYPTKNDSVYESVINANIWSPEAYPTGWRVINE